jgi:hypothetical protein
MWADANLSAAAIPADKLLPATTKGYLSVPSFKQLQDKWAQTQFGQLAADPVMKPFVDDLRLQIRGKLDQRATQLGLTWEDIDSVQSGEVCLATIQPGGDPAEHAAALLVDVTDRAEAVGQLLSKIETVMQERGAAREELRVGDVPVIVYTISSRSDSTRTWKVFLFVHHEQLVATNHQQEAMAILSRFGGRADDVLANLTAYEQVMRRCGEASGSTQPLVRWFVEPLGHARVLRAAAGGRKRRGKDILNVLSGQGFDAIQGIGGHINLATGEHEVLHRTLVYAPPVQRAGDAENKDKYDLAFRMCDFPNGGALVAQEWIPRELATYATLNWKMKEAFEFSSTLVDGMLGEGFFEDFLGSLRDDINGPQIDTRKELIAYLGERATVVADNILPITPESERIAVALELADPDTVAKNLERALESDPYARRLQVDGQTVWEMLSEEDVETPTLVIDGIGAAIPGLEDNPLEEADEEKRILTSSAIAVVHGQLIVASHLDLMKRIVLPQLAANSLRDSVDYQLVNRSLERLGAGEDGLRLFSRTDEEYRTTYELIRQNRMPQAETLLGRLLNRFLGPEEEGVLREQQINGEKLPEYQVVRRYLGPAGLFVRSLEDGWMVTGVVLSKQAAFDEPKARSRVTTASTAID